MEGIDIADSLKIILYWFVLLVGNIQIFCECFTKGDWWRILIHSSLSISFPHGIWEVVILIRLFPFGWYWVYIYPWVDMGHFITAKIRCCYYLFCSWIKAFDVASCILLISREDAFNRLCMQFSYYMMAF